MEDYAGEALISRRRLVTDWEEDLVAWSKAAVSNNMPVHAAFIRIISEILEPCSIV